MNTSSSSPPPSQSLFRGPFYNRRLKLPLLSREKPVISKLAIAEPAVWVCRWRWHPEQGGGRKQIMGFGYTPALAYRMWKLKVMTQ